MMRIVLFFLFLCIAADAMRLGSDPPPPSPSPRPPAVRPVLLRVEVAALGTICFVGAHQAEHWLLLS